MISETFTSAAQCANTAYRETANTSTIAAEPRLNHAAR